VIILRHSLTNRTHILNLPLPEIWYHINDNPRQTPTKVDGLMHHETHDSSGENIVLHVCVPSQPKTLEVIERDVSGRDGIELRPVCVLAVEASRKACGSCVPVHYVSRGLKGKLLRGEDIGCEDAQRKRRDVHDVHD